MVRFFQAHITDERQDEERELVTVFDQDTIPLEFAEVADRIRNLRPGRVFSIHSRGYTARIRPLMEVQANA